MPYVYLIGWSRQNLWYYGVRYAKNCKPEELWESYKTSSIYVKATAVLFGDPDVIQVRKTFSNKKHATRSIKHKPRTLEQRERYRQSSLKRWNG